MKKWGLAFSLVSVLLLAACGGESTDSRKGEENTETETSSHNVLAEEDFDSMYARPADYIDYEVTFTGQVFVRPEKDEDGIYLQVYADPENSEQNTIVAYNDPTLKISEGDFVKITGTVIEEYEGKNMLGATVVAPKIEASAIEVVDYVTAVAPTLKTIEVNKSITQHNLTITLEKIEFAASHTRVYVKVNNDTNTTAYISSDSSKLLVGNKQYETEYMYDTGYPELPYDLLAGVESSGILTFPALDPATTQLQFLIEGHSENYDLDFTPYTFKVQ